MKLVVTIDAEADNQWDHGRTLTTENVGYWQPFQELCGRYEIFPTYLITSEIAADPRAVAFLRPLAEGGRAEVGAHLHPWTTPPYRNEPGLRFNDSFHVFPSQLEARFLHDKLTALTHQITAAFGSSPTSFRAGRFGFNSECAESLIRLGYVVDSSITPLVSWRNEAGLPGGNGGPDFRDQPVHPFRIAVGQGKHLLEIPVTILFTLPLLRQLPWLLLGYKILRKHTGLGLPTGHLAPQPLWLRPYPRTTAQHLVAAWHTAERLGLPAVVMMFHSSELMPGASPYRPTAESVRQILVLLDEFFDFVRRCGGEGMTLTGAAREIALLPDPKEQAL